MHLFSRPFYAYFVIVFQCLICVFGLGCTQKTVSKQRAIAVDLSQIPDTLNSIAPKDIQVICVNRRANDKQMLLMVEDAFTIRHYKAKVKDKKCHFEIIDSLSSGLARLQIWSENQLLATDSVWIKAGAITRVDNYLGPKNVPADGETPTMMVVLPTDTYGNPIAEGSKTNIQTLRKNNQSQTFVQEVGHLIAWKGFSSSTQSGKVIVKSSVANVKGKEKVWEETANPPISFQISIKDLFPKAEDKRFFYLITNKLKDKFGNTLTDGTIVSVRIKTDDDKVFSYTGITIKGIAQIKINNPSYATHFTIDAFVPNICKSNTLYVQFD